jgi:hypothetical protein
VGEWVCKRGDERGKGGVTSLSHAMTGPHYDSLTHELRRIHKQERRTDNK